MCLSKIQIPLLNSLLFSGCFQVTWSVYDRVERSRMINFSEALKQNVILTKSTKILLVLMVLHKIFHYEAEFYLG